MKQFNFKNLVPHLVAIGIFLLVTVIFCKPALESGLVLQQSDVTAVESMKHQSDLYKEKHGVYPLWVTSMFCGMPAYNIIYDGPTSPFTYINQAFQFGLPKPLNFFFLSCLSFYILSLCLRIRPYTAIVASLGFAFATYNPILVVAGHDTKLLALAYAPALLGGIVLLFNKKYFSGFVLTALFANLHLMQNHQQISYYLLLTIGIMTIFFLVNWIRQKELLHGVKALSLALAAAVLAVMINAVLLFPVYDFAKYSKRGGQLVMDEKIDAKENKIKDNKTTGLSRDYAFQWSNDKLEPLTILFPGIYGYGMYYSERDGDNHLFPRLGENSNVAKFFTDKLQVPEAQAADYAANASTKLYWGGKMFTTGPAYQGAIICLLFVLGLFFLDGKHKWWILTASLFGIALSMGRYFPAFNNFMFDYLPLYNKFRTPEMSLVIPQLLFPILGALAIDKLFSEESTLLQKKFKMAAIAMGVLFALTAVLYFSFDYSRENKKRTAAINTAIANADSTTNSKLQKINTDFESETDNRIYEDFLFQISGNANIPDPVSVSKNYISALRADRKAAFGSDIIHAVGFSLVGLALIGLFLYGKVNSTIVIAGLSLLILVDLIPFGMNYVNAKSFESEEKYQSKGFTASAADNQIIQDKDPNYRVFDLSGGDPFQDAKPSYLHKSIGGYHPAKIGIYDDLATYQLSGQINPGVMNMLNAKYIIQKTQDGKNVMAIPNPGALGNCWFVKGVQFVDGPIAEMKALNNFNPHDTAVIDQSFKAQLGSFSPADSSATIRQTAFDNEEISYESNSAQPHLAVFSEIYYKDWIAYIDGQKVPVAKANYVLRSLVIPAGKHQIVFKFEPTVYKMSYTVSLISMWVLMALLAALGYVTFKQSKNANAVA